ncbi:SDR family oxidoreductase [Streptomyces sp. WAC07094]|uniref:SDR family oxidoreductase n=1 Tax=Streptomyces sp. WAC07094 TaxID=3072183 RepID=UPI002EA24468|nr:SDR family oxidoreductase [Streptomyces sp. WAC07094]
MRSHSPGNLVYRVCLVTHATGTGLAAARYLHRQGAQVILTDSDPDDLEITARQLGSRIPAIACDLSTIAGIESLIQQIDDRYGYLDLVHTSIEMTHRHDPYALDEQDFDLYVNATLKSTYFLVTRSLELLNDEASVTLAAHSCCVRDPLCSLPSRHRCLRCQSRVRSPPERPWDWHQRPHLRLPQPRGPQPDAAAAAGS